MHGLKWENTFVDSDIHVVPRDDLREHVPCISCWCRPESDATWESVVIHNALDGREAYEEGRALQ